MIESGELEEVMTIAQHYREWLFWKKIGKSEIFYDDDATFWAIFVV